MLAKTGTTTKKIATTKFLKFVGLLIVIWYLFTLSFAWSTVEKGYQHRQASLLAPTPNVDPSISRQIPSSPVIAKPQKDGSKTSKDHPSSVGVIKAKSATTARRANGTSPPRPRNNTHNEAYTTLYNCTLRNETLIFPTCPYFAILGVQKAATTSLGLYLRQHPLIDSPIKPNRHEIHYFNDVFLGLRRGDYPTEDDFYCYASQRYAQLFYNTSAMMERIVNGNDNDADDRSRRRTPHITFDKTPAYFHWEQCPKDMKRTAPWIQKFVVLLRNPVDRAFSQHTMDSTPGKQSKWRRHAPVFEDRIREEVSKMKLAGLIDPRTTELANDTHATIRHSNTISNVPYFRTTVSWDDQDIAYGSKKLENHLMLRKGMYALQLRRWLKYYDLDNFLVINFDDWKRDRHATFQRILEFVGLPSSNNVFADDPNFHQFRVNNYTGITIRPETKLYLQQFYKPYNDELADMLGEEWRNIWE